MVRFVTLTFLVLSGILATAQPRKVIIDCDPGVDDAMELVLALQSPQLEIVGITTTSFTANIGQCTRNALRVVELSGRNIPVFQGAARPLVTEPLPAGPDIIHGDDKLGNTNQPQPKLRAQPKTAAQFIVDIAKAYPGQITILAEGPLINLADAIRLDSNVTHQIKEVVVSGGAFRVPGLVTPVAEPNIWMDPHAADMVFTAPWKVTAFGLDVTMKVALPDDLLLRVKNENSTYGPFIYSISRLTRDFQMKYLHTEGIIDHGAAALLYLIDPSLFKFTKGPVRVVTDGMARGQTIMPAYEFQFEQPPFKGKPFASVATAVDAERYLKYYENIMKGKR
jgi:inosine-uridine nucleoside N-ribohydrolase